MKLSTLGSDRAKIEEDQDRLDSERMLQVLRRRIKAKHDRTQSTISSKVSRSTRKSKRMSIEVSLLAQITALIDVHTVQKLTILFLFSM